MIKTKHKIRRKDVKQLAFYLLLLAYPLLQIGIFYFGVNINSVLLAFKSYDAGKYVYVGFDNFRVAFYLLKQPAMLTAFRNSLIAYAFGLFVGMALAIFFSYYIYKKYLLSNVFRVMLFMPQVVSAIVMVLVFRYFVDRCLPEIVLALTGKRPLGLLTNPESIFPTIVFYNLFIGFGSNVLLYSGAMSGINVSIIESAKLDGASSFTELFRIVIPMIWQTVVSFVVVGLAGLFSNQLNLYAFFGSGADPNLYTIGYYLFRETAGASNADYPRLATIGIILTVFIAPITLAIRWLLLKFGPSEEGRAS